MPIPTYLHTYIPTYLRTYLPRLVSYVPTYLPTYPPTYPPTYLAASSLQLPACSPPMCSRPTSMLQTPSSPYTCIPVYSKLSFF